MISLYSTYGGLNNVEKKGLYNSYKAHKPQLKAFSEFKISDPDKFRVCQIKGAHFIMHKELQKYNYCGKNNEAPNLPLYHYRVVYRPEWHEAGSIKIENPEELLSKLISKNEAIAYSRPLMHSLLKNEKNNMWSSMGIVNKGNTWTWTHYYNLEYYAAIVEKRF